MRSAPLNAVAKRETSVLLVSKALGSDLGEGIVYWLGVSLDPSRLIQG
jgi:hypothetical protein